MNSILLCEGSTDFVLLQYFMREVYGWADKEMGPKFLRPTRKLEKDNKRLVIGGTGGASQIIAKLEKIIEGNRLSALPEEYYNRIAIVTDRDEVDTESILIRRITQILSEYQVNIMQPFSTNQWIGGEMTNARNEKRPLDILVLIIPFEERGALETFLLNAISKQDAYDKQIIDQCNLFVDRIDPCKRYLTSRRYVTKAKFDVYFSVRTPSSFFRERQNILKGIEWGQYIEVQECFQKLEKL